MKYRCEALNQFFFTKITIAQLEAVPSVKFNVVLYNVLSCQKSKMNQKIVLFSNIK